MPTDQEVFNRVATHLLTQNKRAMEDYYVCQYRGDNGTACAVGCLIPDSVYDPILEVGTVGPLLRAFPWIAEYTGSNIQLLGDLQQIHDDRSVWEWATALRKLAPCYNLELPEILQESK